MTGRPSLPALMETLDLPGTSPIGRPGRRSRTKEENREEDKVH